LGPFAGTKGLRPPGRTPGIYRKFKSFPTIEMCLKSCIYFRSK
jgi:hypothetical protein